MGQSYAEVARVLRSARKRLGKTQDEIATELGKKQPQIAKWEAGDGLPITADVREVARVYQVSPARLLPRTTSRTQSRKAA